MEGQLWKADRKMLYDTVLETSADIVVEVGTWLGGGSTLSISKGLYQQGKGKLYTVEMIDEFHKKAKKSYAKEKPELLPYIEFLLGKSLEVFPPLLKELSNKSGTKRIIDIVFLDGCGTKSKGGHTSTFDEFKLFEKYIKPGGIFMMHDWLDAKAELVKPHIEKSGNWKILSELRQPDSVGFVKAKYLG